MRGDMRILGYLLNRPKIPGASDKQIALFTQFAGTIRDNGSELSQQPGNTLLSYERKHHWAWFIPVTEELTSVGVVFRTEYFKQAGLSKEEMRSPISATTPTKKRELFCKSWLDFPAWKKTGALGSALVLRRNAQNILQRSHLCEVADARISTRLGWYFPTNS